MKAAVSLALVGLMAQADGQVASATAPPTSGAQIFEDVVDECKGRFKGTLGLLYPNDDPGRALDDLSIGICLDYASFLPQGLRTVMCTYRSLFTFINFKLMQRSLREIAHMDYSITADNGEAVGADQQIDLDIADYIDVFADDYCRNLRTDLEAQVAFIEKLEEKTADDTELETFVDFCAKEYPGLNLFMPKLTGLSSDTYLFDAQEICTVFAETITEIKDSEVDQGTPISKPEESGKKVLKTSPFGIQDFAKALQIVAHELYIEKQRMNMRTNCHNSAFMQLKKNKTSFCTTQLDTQLDMTLWSERIQVQACTDSLNLLENLTDTSPECVAAVDDEACDPCSKHYDYFFDKYDVYVLQNVLGIVAKSVEKDQQTMEKYGVYTAKK